VTTAGNDRYPGAGEIALLCEGDLAGYETSIFRRWIHGVPFVDIWACGTCRAVFGFSDAIGRERPICAVLDRDFRSCNEADKDCRGDRKNREDRGIRVLGWRTWRRNEIENYFLDEHLLLPAFSTAFGCKPEDVKQTLNDVVIAILPSQALEKAVYRASRCWTEPDPSSVLFYFQPPVRRRPTWSDASGVLSAPDTSSIEAALKKNAESLRNKRTPCINAIADDFRSFVQEWSAGNPLPWRDDWCGKEILSWLRVSLSSRFGLVCGKDRKRYTWEDKKNRAAWESQDREIEKAMQPDLVAALLESLTNKSALQEVQEEFDSILEAVRPR